VRALTPLQSKIRRRDDVVVHDSGRLVASSVFDAPLCSRSISHNPHADEHDPSACGGQLLIVRHPLNYSMGIYKPIQFISENHPGNDDGFQLATLLGDHLIKNGFSLRSIECEVDNNGFGIIVINGTKRSCISLVYDKESKSWLLVMGHCDTILGMIFHKKTRFSEVSNNIYTCCYRFISENQSMRFIESQ
jgi:hypothetical protein